LFEPRVILHPTDYSDSSYRAFEIAADLARPYRGTILALHVVETLGPENITFGEAVSQAQPAGYQERLKEDFRRHLSPSTGEIPVEYLLVEGDAAEVIPRVARERNCDLIVMGTHGRTGIMRLLTGSIAERVIHNAPCPILITK
jgi:nucleotide-binding universal stress UspA family protein